MSRRKLITNMRLAYAYKTICWFYTGNRKDGCNFVEKPIPHDYVTCFYLDINNNIYNKILEDFRKG